jgi:hypothetical protein
MGFGDRPVIVAVTVMRMTQVPIDQVIDVIAMRDGLVATTRAVNVPRFVLAAVVTGGASIGVLLADRNYVFRHVSRRFPGGRAFLRRDSRIEFVDKESPLILLGVLPSDRRF